MSPKKFIGKLINYKNPKAILVGFLVSLTVFSVLSFHDDALAQTIQDIRSNLEKIERQITQNTERANQAKAEVSTLDGIINRLQTDINTAQQEINNLEKQIKSTEASIISKNKSIATKEKELELQKINQNEIIKTIYETSEQDTVLMLAGVGSISDLISHAEYLETLENDIELIVRTIEDITNELKSDKEELEKKKKDLDENKAQQQAYKSNLVGKNNSQKEIQAEAERQLKTYQSNIANAQRIQEQMHAELARIMRELSGGIQPKDKGVSSIGFQWPTACCAVIGKPRISQGFNEQSDFAKRSYRYGLHTGLDISNVMGTKIYAVADGTVLRAKYESGYGNYVVIGHNARWWTHYAHLSAFNNLYPGKEVKRGDVIGYMGSTGFSSGPHLHFEVTDRLEGDAPNGRCSKNFIRPYCQFENPLSFLP